MVRLTAIPTLVGKGAVPCRMTPHQQQIKVTVEFPFQEFVADRAAVGAGREREPLFGRNVATKRDRAPGQSRR